MQGEELKAWREARGYTQKDFIDELDVKSRQTVSSWERPGHKIPRLVELAVIALEHVPNCNNKLGKKKSSKERREYFDGRHQ